MDAAPPCTAMLTRRLARRMTAIYDEALGPFGLTIGQFGILASLRRSEAVTVATLAERLSSDASTCSRLIRPLAAAGLLAIDGDPADRRAKAIRLTDAGFDRVRAAHAAWQAAQTTVAERLGRDRIAALRHVLADTYAAL